jgi:acyl-coenzyme A synthetase/AMP-(fatty) acid ligase
MERHDYAALRRVLFAGEVFPVGRLRELARRLPHARLSNLYGPTETNVCTWYDIPAAIEADRTEPFPIGRPCPHYAVRVVDEQGRDAPPGTPGELVVRGEGVLKGYWNDPARTQAAFLVDPASQRWYRTGDIVRSLPDGTLAFLGRRDRMVKRHGYRIELGEIEAAIHRHPEVTEAAVVSVSTSEGQTWIKAVVALRDTGGGSEVEMRRFCAGQVPGYMIPDAFAFVDTLPKTSTNKVDYQRLAREA